MEFLYEILQQTVTGFGGPVAPEAPPSPTGSALIPEMQTFTMENGILFLFKMFIIY